MAHDGVSGPVGPYAFIFWNDDLDDASVVARLREIAGAGFVGVTLSARVGLGRGTGYLTAEFLRLVRVAVDECARLGLAVMLYDEASYPSGSANGAVVARDPAFAARCLVPVVRDVVVHGGAGDGGAGEGGAGDGGAGDGGAGGGGAADQAAPDAGYWRPALGRDLDARLLAVVARPVRDGAPSDDGARLLAVRAPGVVRLDLPAGTWQVTAVYDAASGGTIRGAHADQDDGSAQAPPAADLLNPGAVEAFVELTHDAYAAALGEHLGATVVAMFTDEPFLLGRGHRPQARPYTPGLEAEVAARLGVAATDVLRRLPALWDDAGTRPGGTDPSATGFARDWDDAVRDRLARVYYGTLAAWCERHGVALTGHPAEPDDLATTGLLHWPGQDTVWRWVLPGDGTALDGPESTAAKVAASAARLRGAPALTEVLGAYGWQLSLDEARWLLDWYLSRGVTVPVLHAFFHSVRGGRAFESEPDLGIHNSWWPHLPPLVRYVRRVAELLAAHPPVWSVGVLSSPDAAPSGEVVRTLLEAQVDFGYTTDGAGYDVVVDPADGVPDVAGLRERLRGLGRTVVECSPPAPDVRAVVLADGVGTVFFHEGEDRVETVVRGLHLPADACWWDPFTDRRTAVDAAPDGGVRLTLERRRTLVLCAADGAAVLPVTGAAGSAGSAGSAIELTAWTGTLERAICDLDTIQDSTDGPVEAPVLGLGDWTAHPVLRRFSGTYRYTTTFEVPGEAPGEAPGDRPGGATARLDLGVVGEAATVMLDGVPVGHALCAPFTVDLPALTPGEHRLDVLVSNSAATYYEGAGRPSGLIGPVRLTLHVDR